MIGAYGRKTKNPVLIIRAGKDAKEYPNPYDSQTIGTMEEDRFVTFEGNAQHSVLGENYEITSERLNAAIRVANEMTGRPVRFQRRRSGEAPFWLHQISGLDGKGKIIMAKEPIAKLASVINSDKTLNHGAFQSGLAHYFSQEKAGHYSTGNFAVSEVVDSTNPKVTHLQVNFDRTEK